MDQTTVFKVRNNSARSIGLAGKLCIAGAGCDTPEAVKDTTFRLPNPFEMSESDMFKSWRGVVAAMKSIVPNRNVPELEVFVPGIESPLKVAELKTWVAEYRTKNGLTEPKTYTQHAKESEEAMNRPEDWIERQTREAKVADRAAQEARDSKMVATVVESVLKILAERERTAPAPAAPVRAEPRK